jgi:hypothetical protein
MASVYTTGTINAANAAAVGQAMAEKIRDDVVAHAAWDLVEEYTAGSGLVTWYVYKCLAAQSGLPNDFFVVIGRTIASGELRAFICEGYNSSTHVASFYCPAQIGSILTYDSSGRSTLTYALSTAALTASTNINSPVNFVWTPSGTSTKWWIIVSEDAFSVAFNGASNAFYHCGVYVPLNAMPSAMPLLFAGLSVAAQGTLTRNPAAANSTGVSASQYALMFEGGTGAPATSVISQPLGFLGRLDINDKMQSDQRPVAEIGVVIFDGATPASRAVFGWALGKQKRMRSGVYNITPGGAAFGDAYSLSGRLWVPYLPTDSRLWDTGVAG